MVFTVMMVIKGMSYALNNPTKEILYQVLQGRKCNSEFQFLSYHGHIFSTFLQNFTLIVLVLSRIYNHNSNECVCLNCT